MLREEEKIDNRTEKVMAQNRKKKMSFPVCKTECYRSSDLCSECRSFLASCKEFPSGKIGKECKHFLLKIKRAYFEEKKKNAKNKKAAVDNLAVVAARYGVKMSEDRRSVARACMKVCHPDKKADFDDQNKADLAYLVQVLSRQSSSMSKSSS